MLRKIVDALDELVSVPTSQNRYHLRLKNGKYYACFSCEVESIPLPVSDKQIGIDLGIVKLAVTSDGKRIESPQYLRKSEEKLKRKQRAISKKKRGSNRRRKAMRELARLHEKITNQRKDYAHIDCLSDIVPSNEGFVLVFKNFD